MVVDTGVAQKSDTVISAIHALTDKPIFFIVNTNIDDDYAGGNAKLAAAGWALPNASNVPFGHDVSDITGLKMPSGASILAHINVLNRMSAPTGQKSPVAQELWPTDTYETDNWKLFNGEAIYIDYVPAAHTDGDSVSCFAVPMWLAPAICSILCIVTPSLTIRRAAPSMASSMDSIRSSICWCRRRTKKAAPM